MPYNLTAIADNTTGLLGFVQGVNTVLLDGWLGLLFMIGVLVVLFIAFKQGSGDTKKAFVATSFIMFGLTIMLRAIDLISYQIMLAIIIIAALCLAGTFITKD